MFDDYFDRHTKVALQFSGGKDSLAMLHLLTPYLDKLTVVWVNTGDVAQEILAQMNDVRSRVPHFLEVKSDQPAQIVRHGYPADVMGIWDSPLGREMDDRRTFKTQPAIGCCWENLWMPMYNAMKEGNFTLVVRGQRNAEARKARIRSGESEDGVEYWFPLETWSDDQLYRYLDENKIVMPRNYTAFDSSFDCMHCTAYLDENKGKLEYLMRFYPSAAAEVATRLRYIRASVAVELNHIQRTLEAYA